MRLARKRTAAIDRFWDKIQIDDLTGCWNWIAAIDRDGYGVFRETTNKHDSCGRAHKFAYQHYVGVVPANKQLDHICRNRRCANPKHLEIVTLIQNVMRGESFSAVNARKTHCIHGHPLSGDNLYVQPSTGYRYCRECKRISGRRNQ